MSWARLAVNSSLLILLICLTGCAVGNQYRYQSEDVGLPLDVRNLRVAIGVGVKDSRSYVVNGKKPDTFVGLQRGSFGNPFNVTTASKHPFASDVAEVLVDMIGRYGYDVELKSHLLDLETFRRELKSKELSRAVFLNIKEWKTDIYATVTLQYDLELLVFDAEGSVMARSALSGDEGIGGYTLNGNGERASQALGIKLSYLFNNPEVKAALN